MRNIEVLEEWNEQFSGIKKLKLDDVKNLYQKIEDTDNEELKEKYFEKIILGTQHVVYNYLKNSGIYLLSSRELDKEDIISSTYEAWIENIKNAKIKETSSFSKIMQSAAFSNMVMKKLGSVNEEKIVFDCRDKQRAYTIGLNDSEFEDCFIRYYRIKKESKELSFNEKVSVFDNYKTYFNREVFNTVFGKFADLFDDMCNYLECVFDEKRVSDTNLKKYVKLITNNVMTEKINSDLISDVNIDSDILIRERNNLLEEIMSELTEQEKDIIRFRYGFEKSRRLGFEEIGQIFNVTSDRIRQNEAKALRKLRSPSCIEKIKDYRN